MLPLRREGWRKKLAPRSLHWHSSFNLNWFEPTSSQFEENKDRRRRRRRRNPSPQTIEPVQPRLYRVCPLLVVAHSRLWGMCTHDAAASVLMGTCLSLSFWENDTRWIRKGPIDSEDSLAIDGPSITESSAQATSLCLSYWLFVLWTLESRAEQQMDSLRLLRLPFFFLF